MHPNSLGLRMRLGRSMEDMQPTHKWTCWDLAKTDNPPPPGPSFTLIVCLIIT